MQVCTTHLVLIPSYNPGSVVLATVAAARAQWTPVWVVVDGSTDGTTKQLQQMASVDQGLEVMVLPQNGGKGAAILHGLERALARGFTHVLTMDSDGQHDATMIGRFMQISKTYPAAMVLGVPIFDEHAPTIRVKGRKISNGWANVETLGGGIGDSLFGFRVYPARALCCIMQKNVWMRRFDFDPEAVVRLVWQGVVPINVPTRVRYLSVQEGGVSHFHYWRDNVLLTWMHARLFWGFVLRLPLLLWRKAGRRKKTV